MKGLYLAAIDIIVDGLDSIAHYPAMWVFTATISHFYPFFLKLLTLQPHYPTFCYTAGIN
jgi:hypothetical protein